MRRSSRALGRRLRAAAARLSAGPSSRTCRRARGRVALRRHACRAAPAKRSSGTKPATSPKPIATRRPAPSADAREPPRAEPRMGEHGFRARVGEHIDELAFGEVPVDRHDVETRREPGKMHGEILGAVRRDDRDGVAALEARATSAPAVRSTRASNSSRVHSRPVASTTATAEGERWAKKRKPKALVVMAHEATRDCDARPSNEPRQCVEIPCRVRCGGIRCKRRENTARSSGTASGSIAAWTTTLAELCEPGALQRLLDAASGARAPWPCRHRVHVRLARRDGAACDGGDGTGSSDRLHREGAHGDARVPPPPSAGDLELDAGVCELLGARRRGAARRHAASPARAHSRSRRLVALGAALSARLHRRRRALLARRRIDALGSSGRRVQLRQNRGMARRRRCWSACAAERTGPRPRRSCWRRWPRARGLRTSAASLCPATGAGLALTAEELVRFGLHALENDPASPLRRSRRCRGGIRWRGRMPGMEIRRRRLVRPSIRRGPAHRVYLRVHPQRRLALAVVAREQAAAFVALEPFSAAVSRSCSSGARGCRATADRRQRRLPLGTYAQAARVVVVSATPRGFCAEAWERDEHGARRGSAVRVQSLAAAGGVLFAQPASELMPYLEAIRGANGAAWLWNGRCILRRLD